MSKATPKKRHPKQAPFPRADGGHYAGPAGENPEEAYRKANAALPEGPMICPDGSYLTFDKDGWPLRADGTRMVACPDGRISWPGNGDEHINPYVQKFDTDGWPLLANGERVPGVEVEMPYEEAKRLGYVK